MSVVALALSDGVPLYELAAPCAVFGALPPPDVSGDWYDLRVCAPPDARVDRWFRAATPYTYDDLVRADTVIVPACHDGDHHPPAELVAAVAAAYDNGARVMSICTGAFVLAEAGLLDGRRAATHWMFAAKLARRYPRIDVDPEVLFVDDDRVLTSAGKSAGTDLCLHLVRKDHGAHAANSLARLLVSPPHRDGGQAQFIPPAIRRTSPDPLADVMSWALANLSRPLRVEDLAERAHLSTRTLHRQFTGRVGTNPLAWLQRQRIHRAQELLETSDESIESVAHSVGLQSAAVLRRHFQQTVHTSPDRYRRAFRAGAVESSVPG